MYLRIWDGGVDADRRMMQAGGRTMQRPCPLVIPPFIKCRCCQGLLHINVRMDTYSVYPHLPSAPLPPNPFHIHIYCIY
jgi:hypothetical protein